MQCVRCRVSAVVPIRTLWFDHFPDNTHSTVPQKYSYYYYYYHHHHRRRRRRRRRHHHHVVYLTTSP
jgi:hypothetical protein